jgi:3-hydroxy acid dehydrogenase/malonic semialdehyde reductase
MPPARATIVNFDSAAKSTLGITDMMGAAPGSRGRRARQVVIVRAAEKRTVELGEIAVAEAAKKGSALITGAASGIGRAIAEQLAAEGHRVVLTDLDLEGATELAGSLGDKATALQLDITDRVRVDSLPDLIPAAFRPIDILINNAGHDIGGRTRFDLGAADDWSSIIDTNLNGLMRVTRTMLPEMVRRNTGDIVNISSISAIRMMPDMAAYTASKAGVRAFTDILRADLAETGIRVTEILPGLTKTNIILKRHRGDRALEQEYFERFKIALDPADVARSVLFALNQPPHVQIAQLYILPVNRW